MYEWVIERAKKRGHCVIVIAEGAEEGLIDEERAHMRKEMGVFEDKVDASGNIKSVDLAAFVVKDLAAYAKKTHEIKLTVKYLNPTYAIRTAPANGGDQDLCHRLANTAVHCIQSGYTDFSVGLIRNYPVMIPLDLLIKQSSRKLKRKDHEWQRLIQSTGQPSFLSRKNMPIYLGKEKDRDTQRRDHYV